MAHLDHPLGPPRGSRNMEWRRGFAGEEAAAARGGAGEEDAAAAAPKRSLCGDLERKQARA